MINVEEALARLEKLNAVSRYAGIMKAVRGTNVATDRDFQRAYNHFYRVKSRTEAFYRVYYAFMEQGKTNPALTFADVLGHLHETLRRVEASFSAKLLHTLQPDMPTWDRFIGKNTGILIPAYNSRDRIDKAIKRYGELAQWFNAYRDSPDGKELLRLFDSRFPASGISDIKKIDLVLWQTRR